MIQPLNETGKYHYMIYIDVVNAQVQASKQPDKLLYKYRYGERRLNILGSN